MVTQNNSNISSAGLVVYDGVNTFSTDTTTNHNVLIGGASNAITNVAPGVSGTILTSNGVSADPSFQATVPGGVFTINVQTFTGNGTYTPSAGMKFCQIQCWGSGGSAGGVAATGSTGIATSGSGGPGGYAVGIFSAASIGASKAVTVPAGGLAATAGNNAGNVGSTTSVGVLISAGGGSAGSGSAASTTLVSIAAAGSSAGSGGYVNIAGPALMSSFGHGGATIAGFAGGEMSQVGAGRYFSGPTGSAVNNLTSQSLGATGPNFGSGGNGSVNGASQSAASAGAGSGGFIAITEYIFV